MNADPQLLEAIDAFQRGDLDRARTIAEQQVRSAPSPKWRHFLGLIQCRLGDYATGVSQLRAAHDEQPSNSQFRVMLVRALIDCGRAREALEIAETPAGTGAAELPLWQVRAEAAEKAGDPAAAADAYRTIASATPGGSYAWASLARNLLLLERISEAEDSYRQAVAVSPTNVDALHELGMVYQRTNRLEDLSALLEQALRDGVPKDELAYLWAVRAHRLGQFDEAGRLLGAAPPARPHATRWYRLKARVADELGEHSNAFACAAAMNAAAENAEGWRQRAAAYRKQLRLTGRTITADWAKRLPALDPPELRPVFLVGFPRSGTTLLDTFLMGHRAIAVLEEKPLLFDAAPVAGRIGSLPDHSPEDFDRMRAAYLSLLEEHVELGSVACVVDKFPLNLVAAPLIHLLFPGSPILFAQRHPCDAVLSGFMQRFVGKLGMASFLDIGDSADFYDAAMTVWASSREVLPLNVHTVVYEDLVRDPEAVLKPVVGFLGLKWDDRILDHRRTAKERGTIVTPSYDQVTEPLTTRTSGRWKQYREQLAPVLPVLLPWAERLGYRD